MKIPLTNKNYLQIIKLLSKKSINFYDSEDLPIIQNIKQHFFFFRKKWILHISKNEQEILIFYLQKLEHRIIIDKRLPRDKDGNIFATPQNIKFLNEICNLIDYIETF